MFFWNSLAFLMIQLLDISSVINIIPTPFHHLLFKLFVFLLDSTSLTVAINIVSMKVDDFGCKFCLVKEGSLLETYFGQGDGPLAQFSSHTVSFEIDSS